MPNVKAVSQFDAAYGKESTTHQHMDGSVRFCSESSNHNELSMMTPSANR